MVGIGKPNEDGATSAPNLARRLPGGGEEFEVTVDRGPDGTIVQRVEGGEVAVESGDARKAFGLVDAATLLRITALSDAGLGEKFEGLNARDLDLDLDQINDFWRTSFPGLSEEGLAEMLKFTEVETLDGRVIGEGSTDQFMYFLLQDTSAVFNRSGVGAEAYSFEKSLKAGDHFGERVFLGDPAMSNVDLNRPALALKLSADIMGALSPDDQMIVLAKLMQKHVHILEELNLKGRDHVEGARGKQVSLTRKVQELSKEFVGPNVSERLDEQGFLKLLPGEMIEFQGCIDVLTLSDDGFHNKVATLRADVPDSDFVGEASAFGFPQTAILSPTRDCQVRVIAVAEALEAPEVPAEVKAQLGIALAKLFMGKVASQAKYVA